MRLSIARAVLLLIAVGPGLARASVIFSNVTGSGSGGRLVTGTGILTGGNNALAEAFTPGANYTLTDAQFLVSTTLANASTFDVFLESNNAGVPGSVIEQIGFGLSATTPGGSLITANSIATPITLASGTAYWVVLTAHASNTSVGWIGGGSPSVPRWISTTGGSTWFVGGTDSMQFQIDGTQVASVPEPSTVAMFGLGGLAALLYGIGRRRKNS